MVIASRFGLPPGTRRLTVRSPRLSLAGVFPSIALFPELPVVETPFVLVMSDVTEV